MNHLTIGLFALISSIVIYNYGLNSDSPLMLVIGNIMLYSSCWVFVHGLKKFIEEIKS